MKTAVEFIESEVKMSDGVLTKGHLLLIIEQAKAMEKEHKTQIIKDYFEWHKSKGFVSHKITDIEDFCNETFKSE